MKVVHHHTLWYHTAFALAMAVILTLVLLLNHNVTALAVALFLAIYIGGHIVLHIRRDDLRPDTVVEYVLLGAAVFVVLASTLH